MIFGVDFDNTIVCYDDLVHRAALDLGLIPATLPPGKGNVRDHLRQEGREDDWTRLQGHVYGVTISDAPVFPGVLEFLETCRERGVDVFIVSHKTRHPVLGDRHDLHRAAHDWLDARGFYETTRTGLSRERVFFELTKQQKLERIGSLGCSHFVDDLPEFLLEPAFPAGVERILFDPRRQHMNSGALLRAESWPEVSAVVPAGLAAR
jgi:FMN phosphatase YigB (HAD superfamily)